MLTPDQLAAIKARLDASTPGKWALTSAWQDSRYMGYICSLGDHSKTDQSLYVIAVDMPYRHAEEDGEFIAHAPEDVTLLLAELERLIRHNQRMAAALAQLSDKENWLQAIGLVALSEDNEIAGIGSDAEFTYIWMASNNPQQLAERALVEDQ